MSEIRQRSGAPTRPESKTTSESPSTRASLVKGVANISNDRRFEISAEGPDEPWSLRFLDREEGGDWRVDPTPGLRIDYWELPGFRDFLLSVLQKHGMVPPRPALEDVAQRYREEVEEGDPDALVIVRVLDAMALALREDPEVATDLLVMSDTYLRRKRPGALLQGAGDPRLKRSGRTPAAAEALLRLAKEVAETQEVPLDATERAKGYADDFDSYAEALAWEVGRAFPGTYPPRDLNLARQAVAALAETLRKKNLRTPQKVARAALRAFGMPEDTVRNFFSYQSKKK